MLVSQRCTIQDLRTYICIVGTYILSFDDPDNCENLQLVTYVYLL